MKRQTMHILHEVPDDVGRGMENIDDICVYIVAD